MKHARILMITVLLISALCVCVQAQERPLLTATIPFSFTVGTTDMPAGTYTVYTLPPYNMIKIQSANTPNLAMVSAISQPSMAAEQGKLLFRRIGNHHYLTQISEQGSTVRRDVRTSSSFARELAKDGQSTTVLASANSSH